MRQPFSMYRRNNGVWYYATYTESGKRVYRSTGTTKKGEAYAIIMQRVRAGNLIEKQETVLCKFKDIASGFWDYDTCPVIQEKLSRGGTYTRRTASDNARITDTKLIPFFGDMFICDIGPVAIRKWMISISKTISPKSVNNALIVLRQILDEAVIRDIIGNNPARQVKPLIPQKSKRGCFLVEQVKDIIANCPNDMIRMMVKLAAKTGMRMGEIRALTMEQIKDRFILVDASWNTVDGRKGTKAGYSRIVPIDPVFRNELIAFAMAPEGLIFTNNGSVPVSSSWVDLKFTEAMDKAGINWKEEQLCFHSLRHFANTQMLSGGVSPDIVRKIIGHTSTAMTDNYLHMSDDAINSVYFLQNDIS